MLLYIPLQKSFFYVLRAGVVHAAFGALGTARCVIPAGYFVATAPRAFTFSAGEHAHRDAGVCGRETCGQPRRVTGARRRQRPSHRVRDHVRASSSMRRPRTRYARDRRSEPRRHASRPPSRFPVTDISLSFLHEPSVPHHSLLSWLVLTLLSPVPCPIEVLHVSSAPSRSARFYHYHSSPLASGLMNPVCSVY